jgi:hypothetical protein
VLYTSSQAVLAHGEAISAATIALSCKLEEFLKASSQSTAKLCKEATQFEAEELQRFKKNSERIGLQKRFAPPLQLFAKTLEP